MLAAPPALQAIVRMQRADDVVARRERDEALAVRRLVPPMLVRTPAQNSAVCVQRARVPQPHADCRVAVFLRTLRRLPRVIAAAAEDCARIVQPASVMRPRCDGGDAVCSGVERGKFRRRRGISNRVRA